ncbi:hypothetical protein B0A52_00478 [Exophiala mesophila]|uniref:DnaJ homologue subfamily C member 28 conserved domain-containing protein n=1 Tax=Exophiala mesophila TaxID=212818 RepID=A0A438NK52_EXOME|nr:hypothetical protein B0A52_00478 [Exophiala mesophila]
MGGPTRRAWTCARCLRAQKVRGISAPAIVHDSTFIRRSFHVLSPLQDENPTPPKAGKNANDSNDEVKEQGAMSRRLADMAEETMDTGSKSDQKLMKEVFSDELKKQLEERIAQTSFSGQNQRAASQVNMPDAAGKGTRGIAGAEPWTGSESLHDAALRMLDDSHKKLRSPYRPPALPQKNLHPGPKKNVSAANRLANARDKTSIYAISQQNDMDEKEREKWRKELKERFSPGARPMPTSLQGLTSLANERIEDAIARGQFKNISRGKGINVERDYNANSPFLDTTEYFMNKIIQKQEIVPPWIEKQQELVKLVATFRSRLRNDWRRHAARSIASSGGTVQDQVRRAQGYALAEELVNPRIQKKETLSSISSDGVLTTVTVEERLAAGVPMESQESEQKSPDQVEITVTEKSATETNNDKDSTTEMNATPTTTTDLSTIREPTDPTNSPSLSPSSPPSQSPASPRVLPMPYPFRDPHWEKTELKYHTLAIQELNSLTRSYNLMAPKIAQKPYYTLARELKRCFADIAPSLPDEILQRSRKPVVKIAVMPHQEGGVLERFGSTVGAKEWKGHEGVIREEDGTKGYGFKEFWRDLFGNGKAGKRRENLSS